MESPGQQFERRIAASVDRDIDTLVDGAHDAAVAAYCAALSLACGKSICGSVSMALAESRAVISREAKRVLIRRRTAQLLDCAEREAARQALPGEAA